MYSYLNLIKDILTNGEEHDDRTGTGTLSVFGRQFRHCMSDGFPLLTTKKVSLRHVAGELFWFLAGDTDAKTLQDQDIHIWDDWQKPYTLDRELVEIEPRKATLPAEYHGDCKQPSHRLGNTWQHIIRRCYNPEHHAYKNYGGCGYTVHQRWHHFENFAEDVIKLPHWFYKNKYWDNFVLDSDYFGAKQYGPDTCVWLRKDENLMYSKKIKPIKVIRPDKKIQYFLSQSAASKAIGMRNTTFTNWLKLGEPDIIRNENWQFIGWRFEEVDIPLRLKLIPNGAQGAIYSKQWRDFKGVDQIKRVVEMIQHDPNSRRICCTVLDPSEVDQMSLEPCHMFWQVKIHGDGTMSLHMYMRSCDAFLGLTYNIASYALLLQLLCHVTGRVARDLIISFGDVHIYKNHIDQCKLQLEREPKKLPMVLINYRLKDGGFNALLEASWTDIDLVGYDHWPAIKGEISI